MSDATGKDVNDGSTIRELDSERKIAALKERLAHDHTGSVINGTNGNTNHSKNSKTLMSKPENIFNLPLGSFKLSDNLLRMSPAAINIGSESVVANPPVRLESVDSILIIDIVSGAGKAASLLLRLLLLLPT